MPTTARRNLASFTPPRPNILVHLSPAKPTVVYDTYWKFSTERQRIFFARIAGQPAPWTDDPVLQAHKFTNAYRASDRVSQYLIRSVIYRGDQDPIQLCFRILLFKIFNRIDTWELLEREFGEVRYAPGFVRAYDQVLTRAMAAGKRIYSPAYIMPSGGKLNKTGRKHRMHLDLLARMITDHLPQKLIEAGSMQEAFSLLLGYPTIGDFLAYQYVTDLNYSPLLNFDEMHFVVPGPGALNGIAKCFADFGGLTEVDLIKIVAERQEAEFTQRGLKFQSLWGRKLQLIDCQNLFCEVDKYSRVAHPEFGSGGRTRIKQRFSPHSAPISYWFPPKWKINERITLRPMVPHDSLL
ncbi:nucleotide kinase domain-containing protein [Opitutus sp. GAS368]|uniref:nucleotide kinase domain-containing protein n=1 Tax=Opitutus sp. GAS368 TaxID=1882749 RepID=UPI0008792BF8|nr:nucleotide kinase domain-containing protein [Opitutus sp. GAS368]SDS02100.1 hypothetical protein SAMN05444173_1648 [Opitutus sp. GAS368]